MSLDLTTLQLLKYRSKYDRYSGAVPATAMSPQTQVIIKDFGRWFREFDGAGIIDLELFPAWFKSVHPTLKDEAIAVYSELFKRIKEDVPEHVESGIGKRWISANTASKVTSLLEQWNAGDEVDLGVALKQHIDDYEARVDRKVKNLQVLDPIEELLEEEENDVGIRYPWESWNKHIKPMRGGDFFVLAMRVDKGKSTACAQIATFAAPQIDKLYPGENRSILVLNNEGVGKRLVMRNFQSALNATVEDLIELSNKPADEGYEHYKTKVRQEYARALGGRPGVLRVMDIHGLYSHEVEDIIKLHRPALIIFDMIDLVRFSGDLANGGQRTDQVLEAQYQWARLLGVKYDCAIIANSQLSADAEGVPYPTLTMLKDSKTGKAGAADVVVVGGASNDVMLANSRYWSTPKNKKARTGVPGYMRVELLLQGDRARYVDTTSS